MKANIHTARDPFLERKKSKGQTLEVSRGPITSIRALSKGNEVASLEITATRSHRRGTGEREGKSQFYDDKLTLQLEPRDLNEILTAAIKHRLISVHFKAKSGR